MEVAPATFVLPRQASSFPVLETIKEEEEAEEEEEEEEDYEESQ